MRINNDFLEDPSMRLMQRFLDMSVQRQALISSNLANVDTPGYKTVDLDFERELEGARSHQEGSLAVTDFRHIPTGIENNQHDSVIEVENLTSRNDLNNVNIDREMTQLSTNALNFSMVAQLIAGKFHLLKSAITGGA